MEQNQVKTTTLGSIGTSLLVLILLIIVVVIVIYVIQTSLTASFPISPFNYEQTVVIRPAILANGTSSVTNPDQYLTDSSTINYTQTGCIAPYSYGDNAHALTFTGKKEDTRSQWILKQKSALCDLDSNQSLVLGQGNRFFLENKARAGVTPGASSNRVRYQRLNQNSQGFCLNTSPAVIGSDGTEDCNWFNTELIVYFLPTNFPNLYYILFPSCSGCSGSGVCFPCALVDTTTQPNDGIVSFRPWSPNNDSNRKVGETCNQCSSDSLGTFNPYVNQDITQGLNQNVMIMNNLFTIKPDGNILPPYPNANIFLFEVTTTA